MRNVLQAERPDFVVFSGDQVTGNNIHDNATVYWGQALKPVLEAGYRWSIVFGNHDDLADGTNGHREDLLKFDTSFTNSYSQFGPRDIHGLSNYYLAIYPPSSDELPPVPLSLLYFLDSGGGTIPEIVYPDQVEWYIKTSAMLQSSYGKALPSLAFFHIPTEQYVNAFNPQVCFGVQQDDIAPQQSSNGLLDAFQKMGDVKASFVGHNHGNDWCCPTKQSIKICYGRHTGYGGYGAWARGSRIIQVQIEKSSGAWKVQSWVRMEDGTVVDGGTIAATP
ncbi:Phosphatase dcr2 [Balamuthia mandrillaris]